MEAAPPTPSLLTRTSSLVGNPKPLTLIRRASTQLLHSFVGAAGPSDEELAESLQSRRKAKVQSDEDRRRKARMKFKAAGKAVIGARRLQNTIVQKQEERIQAELDHAEEEEEEEEEKQTLEDKIKLCLFIGADTVCRQVVNTVKDYPSTVLCASVTIASVYQLRAPVHEGNPKWPGAWNFISKVGFWGLYRAFLPWAASRVLGNTIHTAVPRMLAITGHNLGFASRTVLNGLALVPVFALEQQWAREFTNCVGLARTAADRTGLWGTPWWVVFTRLLHKTVYEEDDTAELSFLLPAAHPIADRRSFVEAVHATPWYIPRLLLAPLILTPLPDFTWGTMLPSCSAFMYGLVFGNVVSLPLTMMYNRLSKMGTDMMFESTEDRLSRKLEHAAARSAHVRARIDVPSVTRPVVPSDMPSFKRQNTLELKKEAAANLAVKREALLSRIRVYANAMANKDVSQIRAVTVTGQMVSVQRSDIRSSLRLVARASQAAVAAGEIAFYFLGEQHTHDGGKVPALTDSSIARDFEPGLFRDYMQQVAAFITNESNSKEEEGEGESKLEPLFVPGPDGGLLPKHHTGDGGGGGKSKSSWREELFAVGRLMALSVIRETPFDVCFSRCIYKVLTGESVSVSDVARINPDFVKHRLGTIMHEGGVSEMEVIMDDELYFVGVDGATELIPGGAKLRVTEQNKKRYVALLVEHYLVGHCREELAVLVEGFQDIIPHKVLSEDRGSPTCLASIDLDLVVAGLQAFNVEDWKEHCVGNLEQPANKNVGEWFWEVVGQMSDEKRAKLLSFACGASRVPAAGFKALKPPFNVYVTGEDLAHLPTAHTCFNQLCLPRYTSKEQLQKNIMKVTEDDVGFGFL